MRELVLAVVTLLFLNVTRGVRAQDAAAPAAPAVAAPVAPAPAAPAATLEVPPDIVRFNNGAMVRGVITEYVPDSHVDIKLANGDWKRFSAAEIAYAGPAQQQAVPAATPPAPPAAPAAPPAPTEPVTAQNAQRPTLHFEATDADAEPLTLYLRGGIGHVYGPRGGALVEAFERVCTAPCDAEVPAGAHVFAIARSDGSPVATKEAVNIAGPTRLIGRYESRRKGRIAGLVLCGAMAATGFGLAFGGGVGNGKTFGAGLGLAAGGIALSFPVVLFGRDRATISAQPAR